MPWQKTVAILLVVLNCFVISGLGVNAYMVNGELRHLKNQMTYLSDTSSVILSGVDTMRDDIEQTLKEEASLIEDWSIDLKKTNFATGTYVVSLKVIPKEYTENTQMEMYFGTKKYDLQLENYKYVGEAKLSLRNRYDGNVTVLIVNGKKKNTEVLSSYRDIQTGFEEILSGELKEIPTFEDGVMKVNQAFSYTISEKNQYGFTSLELIIEGDKEKLDVFDLLTEEEDSEEENEKQDRDASDQNERSEEELELSEDSEVEEEPVIREVEPVYLINGSYHVKESYEVEEGTPIRIFLRGESQEGFTFTYDLFYGITEEGAVKGFADAEDYFAANPKVYDSVGALELE